MRIISREKKIEIICFYDLVLYFLKLGFTGFGGPVALAAYMHRDLVEKRKCISED